MWCVSDISHHFVHGSSLHHMKMLDLWELVLQKCLWKHTAISVMIALTAEAWFTLTSCCQRCHVFKTPDFPAIFMFLEVFMPKYSRQLLYMLFLVGLLIYSMIDWLIMFLCCEIYYYRELKDEMCFQHSPTGDWTWDQVAVSRLGPLKKKINSADSKTITWN